MIHIDLMIKHKKCSCDVLGSKKIPFIDFPIKQKRLSCFFNVFHFTMYNQRAVGSALLNPTGVPADGWSDFSNSLVSLGVATLEGHGFKMLQDIVEMVLFDAIYSYKHSLLITYNCELMTYCKTYNL